ncbi:MAG TPA: L-histidine N(alpha)-methyltransferase [Candidatus Saccharimonadales bacterium]|nr:L-histidine N(alpha)-methyltransferase [Candidatus Saccharimonadales bacterium]
MTTAIEIANHYNDIAQGYNNIVGGNGWSAPTKLAEVLREDSMAVHRAIDLGAGTGLSTEVILQETSAEHIVAVDISAKMLQQLLENCAYNTRITTEETTVVDYLRKTPLTFDLVVALGLIHLQRKIEPVFSGIAGVTSDNAQLIFTYDPYISEHRIHGTRETRYGLTSYRRTAEEIEDCLYKNGFGVVRYEPFAPRPNVEPEYESRFVVAKKITSLLASCRA